VLDQAASDVTSAGGHVSHRYYESERPVLNGFAAAIPDSYLSTLKHHPSISYIEPDGVVSAYAQNLLATSGESVPRL